MCVKYLTPNKLNCLELHFFIPKKSTLFYNLTLPDISHNLFFLFDKIPIDNTNCI